VRVLASLALIAIAGCGSRAVSVEYRGAATSLARPDRGAIERIAEQVFRDARERLPGLPRTLTLVVAVGHDVIPETGESATNLPPERILWTLDPDRAPPSRTFEAWLRGTMLHELHHLARSARIQDASLLDNTVTEGMATVFERDEAHVEVPWGRYPPEVARWLDELLAQPPNASREAWLFRHPDGRRWIAFKVGTWLVDRAIAAGRAPATLLPMTAKDIVAIAR
jgi:hypothetical protein